MKRRLVKEMRAIAPVWIVAVLLPLASAPFESAAESFVCLYALSCSLLGAAVFGHEFNHQTMGLLLAQPISRRRLWYEKMGVLGTALIALCVAIGLGLWWPVTGDFDGSLINRYNSSQASFMLFFMAVAAVCALGASPGLTLLLKNTIATVTLAPLLPLIFSAILFFLSLVLMPQIMETFNRGEIQWLFFGLPTLAYAAMMYLLGCRRLARFESKDAFAPEINLPGSLKAPLDWLLKNNGLGLPRNYVQLIGKEFHLHKVSFLLAGLLGLTYGALAVVKWLGLGWPLLHSEDLVFNAPMVVYWFILPVLIGTVTVGEERNFGILEWHLVLPPSRWKQWCVKVGVAYLVLLIIGVLLPLVILGLGITRGDLFTSPTAIKVTHLLQTIPLLLITTSLAILASSLSANTLRATLLTFGIGLLAVAVLGGLEAIVAFVFSEIEYYELGLGIIALRDAGMTNQNGAVIVLFSVAILLWMPYTNYRRNENNPHRVVLQSALAAVTLCAFLIGGTFYWGNLPFLPFLRMEIW